MIAELKAMTDRAQPTAFHSFLKELDDQGKLFRVYTQNIDCLEARAGLSYGLGDTSTPVGSGRRKSAAASSSAAASPAKKRATRSSSAGQGQDDYPTPASSYQGSPPPPPAIPRVIPLHGHLATLSCAKCSNVVDLDDAYASVLAEGGPPECPVCVEVNSARESAGERLRGVGLLKPDVVLYGEPHPDGERVGEITRRDLMGARPDLVIVVGTSLKVPGTKRLVRELAKVAHPAVRMGGAAEEMMPSASQDSLASTSSARSRRLKPKPVHVVYLNYDFPTPAREWQGVFDVWARGDAQEFVEAVEDEKRAEADRVMARIAEKERLAERRREREELAACKAKEQPTLKFAPIKKTVVVPKAKPKAVAQAPTPAPAPAPSRKRQAVEDATQELAQAAKKVKPMGTRQQSFTLEIPKQPRRAAATAGARR